MFHENLISFPTLTIPCPQHLSGARHLNNRGHGGVGAWRRDAKVGKSDYSWKIQHSTRNRVQKLRRNKDLSNNF